MLNNIMGFSFQVATNSILCREQPFRLSKWLFRWRGRTKIKMLKEHVFGFVSSNSTGVGLALRISQYVFACRNENQKFFQIVFFIILCFKKTYWSTLVSI